jgi:hypothetical protein
MLIKSLKALSATSLVLFSLGTAQAASDVDDGGGWLQVVAEGSLGALEPRLPKTHVWLEGQSRYDNNWNQWYQGMLRTAVGYSLSDRATIWAGYTWLPTHNVGKSYVSQQDVWPAFRYVLPTSVGTVTFRTMFESNFIDGSDVRFRPRQMVKFMHPLAFEPRLSVIAWDEFFIRTNTTRFGGQSGFDQNRIFGGLGWTFNKNVRSELGYMNQYIDSADHSTNTTHNLIMGSLFINF